MMPNFPSEYEAEGRKQMTLEYNREQKEFLETKNGKTLEGIYNDPYISRELVSLFECSECSGPLEVSALRHFNFDIEVAKCHRCQHI
jgi:hypothetical protein